MNLREMQYLVALADLGHFGRAAEHCHVNQSTLSIQLKKLEAYLGVVIFDRSLSKVAPTAMGKPIVEAARRITAEAEHIRALARSAGDPMNRTVRLGVFPTLAPYYLPSAMVHLQKVYSLLKLHLLEWQTAIILQKLLEGEIDCALLALPVEAVGLVQCPLFYEPFMVALPHSLANNAAQNKHTAFPPEGAISAELLMRQDSLPLLLLEDGHCLRGQALSVCQLKNPYTESVRATSLETLRQMVGQGMGYTLIPHLACQPLYASFASSSRIHAKGRKKSTESHSLIDYRPLSGHGAGRTIGFVYREHSPLQDTFSAMIKILLSHLPEGVEAIAEEKKVIAKTKR